MRERMLGVAIFGVLIFFIPFLAMHPGEKPMQLLPVKNASMQDGNSQNAAAPVIPPEPEASAPGEPVSEQPNTPRGGPAAAGAVDDGFTILDERTGKLLEVTPRDYVRGALAAELPPTFHPEALKAQAVAAHTYALNFKAMQRASPDPALKGADLAADPRNWKSFTTEEVFRERYGSLADAYWKSICEAADAVEPYVLTYEGEPIVAAYHSMSAGTTEDAANVWNGGKPYLTPVDSFGDTLAPDYRTTRSVPVAEARRLLTAAWPAAEPGDDPGGWITVQARSESGYVTEAAVGGLTVPGKEVRSVFGLRSADFKVGCDGENINFTVVGYGHGVGLSQYGADYMARQGADFEEILAHYYPGTTLALARKS